MPAQILTAAAFPSENKYYRYRLVIDSLLESLSVVSAKICSLHDIKPGHI